MTLQSTILVVFLAGCSSAGFTSAGVAADGAAGTAGASGSAGAAGVADSGTDATQDGDAGAADGSVDVQGDAEAGGGELPPGCDGAVIVTDDYYWCSKQIDGGYFTYQPGTPDACTASVCDLAMTQSQPFYCCPGT